MGHYFLDIPYIPKYNHSREINTGCDQACLCRLMYIYTDTILKQGQISHETATLKMNRLCKIRNFIYNRILFTESGSVILKCIA